MCIRARLGSSLIFITGLGFLPIAEASATSFVSPPFCARTGPANRLAESKIAAVNQPCRRIRAQPHTGIAPAPNR
ncbi:hypothetical protein FNJ47_25840 [Bradyrhizobium sp. UFLA 03-164]|uniref:Porin n=1 Tax=Bradyrhizobium uaiense TaxID=2594946 RepID=A0A6P1BKX6_9BRAD|nr:hypothetical protein [Bradyrhizobium uaiense]